MYLQIESTCISIHEILKVVADTQTKYRLREAQDRIRAEDLNAHVSYWSIGEAVIICVVSIGQVLMLKSFFKEKKTSSIQSPQDHFPTIQPHQDLLICYRALHYSTSSEPNKDIVYFQQYIKGKRNWVPFSLKKKYRKISISFIGCSNKRFVVVVFFFFYINYSHTAGIFNLESG